MVPKYEEIKNDIIDKILKKELNPGEKVSSEAELKNQYGVSSTTVVKALNELVAEGFVYRVQGKGTFISKALRGTTVKYYENDYQFYDRSDEQTRVISVTDNEDPEIQKLFEPNTRVKQIVRLRLAKEDPIQLFNTFIDAEYINEASTEELQSIYETVKNKTNVNLFDAHFKEDFSVLFPVPEEVSKLMGIDDTQPIIKVQQKTYAADGHLIEYIRSYKRYDYFDISITSI